MIPWVTAVVSARGTTLHPAATRSARAASALGPRWAFCSKDILPCQDDSKKEEGLLRTALRQSCSFSGCCWGIKAAVGHLICSQCLHPFKLKVWNKKQEKVKAKKNLHLNTGFFVKIVTVTCFPLKRNYGSLTLTKYCKLLIVTHALLAWEIFYPLALVCRCYNVWSISIPCLYGISLFWGLLSCLCKG